MISKRLDQSSGANRGLGSAGAVEQPNRHALGGVQAPAANGTRRWDDARPQERNTGWNGDPRQPVRDARDADTNWRGGGVGAVGATRFGQPKNDIHWRKAGDPPAPAVKPTGVLSSSYLFYVASEGCKDRDCVAEPRREAAAAQGVAAPSFAAAHGLVPGARAAAGVRPHGAAAPFTARVPAAGHKRYRKEDLLGVLTSMKQQVG
jgi:hypothetical protein